MGIEKNTHTIKGLRSQFKAQGKFHTPSALVELIAGIAKAKLGEEPIEVYDPTCGAGDLLSAFPNAGKYGQDIDREAVKDACQNLTYFNHEVGDVLVDPAWLWMKFQCIVANPPFSIKWIPQEDERFTVAPAIPTQSKADYAFILHILHMLADDGVAVVMGFPGILYRGGREGKIRQWMVENHYITDVYQIPGGHFEDTAIATCLLVLRKDNRESWVQFHDLEHGLKRIVPHAEIAANDFNLSVSSYVQPPEPEREEIDPWELQQQARREAIDRLKADIAIDKQVCMLEGWNHELYLQQLTAAIRGQEILDIKDVA